MFVKINSPSIISHLKYGFNSYNFCKEASLLFFTFFISSSVKLKFGPKSFIFTISESIIVTLIDPTKIIFFAILNQVHSDQLLKY